MHFGALSERTHITQCSKTSRVCIQSIVFDQFLLVFIVQQCSDSTCVWAMINKIYITRCSFKTKFRICQSIVCDLNFSQFSFSIILSPEFLPEVLRDFTPYEALKQAKLCVCKSIVCGNNFYTLLIPSNWFSGGASNRWTLRRRHRVPWKKVVSAGTCGFLKDLWLTAEFARSTEKMKRSCR